MGWRGFERQGAAMGPDWADRRGTPKAHPPTRFFGSVAILAQTMQLPREAVVLSFHPAFTKMKSLGLTPWERARRGRASPARLRLADMQEPPFTSITVPMQATMQSYRSTTRHSCPHCEPATCYFDRLKLHAPCHEVGTRCELHSFILTISFIFNPGLYVLGLLADEKV